MRIVLCQRDRAREVWLRKDLKLLNFNGLEMGKDGFLFFRV
jgi:hypothetical protein